MARCEICGKEATARLSPDLDIDGLGVCGEHEEIVRLAYIILVTSGEEEYNSFVKGVKNSYLREQKKKGNNPD